MEIWLRQDKNEFRLPVLPSSIEIGNSMQNTTVNITELGEVNLIGKSDLKTLNIATFFPAKKYNFVHYTDLFTLQRYSTFDQLDYKKMKKYSYTDKDFPTPQECVNLIKSWMDNPIQVTITGFMKKQNMTIESFNYTKQDATGDVYFTLELKEYRKPKLEIKIKPKVVSSTFTIQKPNTNRDSKKVKSTVYIVKSGDTLASIAKKLTGSATNYKAIANQNHISNPSKIYIGQKLVIKV